MALGLDETVQILLDGIRFNASEDSDADGCYWPVKMAGWSSRQTKTQRTAKPVLPGSYRAPNPTAEKIISIIGTCIAPSDSVRALAEERLQALCPDPQLTYRIDVTEESGTKFRMVELEFVDIERYNEVAFKFTIQLAALDPFKYSTTLQSASVGLPSAGSGGLNWTAPGLNWTAPGLDWGTPTMGGTISLTNAGLAEAWPTFTISTGANALVNPKITEQSTGRQLAYNGTLLAGDTLVIDTSPNARTVLLNGVADRRPFLTKAEWFPIPAKGSTAAVFTADVFSATALLLAEWRNTYF
jgi:hypothetical protein